MLGVGITFNHLSPSELLGRCISVEVPTVGDSISIQLKGKVTNVKSTRGTAVPSASSSIDPQNHGSGPPLSTA